MITGSAFNDGGAVILVTLLLPLAMYSMRGTSKMKSRVAALASITIVLSLFSMVALSLIYASYHRVDFAAAAHPSIREVIEELSCKARNLTEGRFVSSRSPQIINIAGVSTGLGWWRQALLSFSQESGLLFDEGGIDRLDCHSDLFQLEVSSETDLLKLPRPHKASFIVRDPRSVIVEVWLQERSRCGRPSALIQICNSTRELGINIIASLLKEEECSGKMAYLCSATSIAAQAALENGMRFFQYEEFWTSESSVLVDLARWYGLQHEQLQAFLRVGRIWTEEFHRMMESSPIAQARKPRAWKQYMTGGNLLHFQRTFGSVAKDLGYQDD